MIEAGVSRTAVNECVGFDPYCVSVWQVWLKIQHSVKFKSQGQHLVTVSNSVIEAPYASAKTTYLFLSIGQNPGLFQRRDRLKQDAG